MKLNLQGGPGVTLYVLAAAAVFALFTNLAQAQGYHFDINTVNRELNYQADQSRRDYDSQFYNFQNQNAESARQHQRFMDNEYGSQTPNDSCYLCGSGY